MSLFDLFKANERPRGTAQVACERLKIVMAHERNRERAPDYLPALQDELLAVISKYVRVANDDIKVQFERQEHYDILEVNITLPER